MQPNEIFYIFIFYVCMKCPTANKFYTSSAERIFLMSIYILFEALLNNVVLCVARRCDAAANFVGNEETFVVDSIVETQRAIEGSRCRC